MEYQFGTRNGRETLRTKDTAHTKLTGFHEIVRTFPDRVVTDNFRVVRKYKTDTRGADCYDWYEIDHHFRNVDRTPPLYDAGADVDELLVDYELRILMLELGLEE